MVENVDYFVHLVDFPVYNCGAAVTLNDDGTYTVFVNSRLTREKNMVSIEHECKHMEHDDFHRDIPISQKEREAG